MFVLLGISDGRRYSPAILPSSSFLGLLGSCGVLELGCASRGEFIEIQIGLDAILQLGTRVPPAQLVGLFLAVV